MLYAVYRLHSDLATTALRQLSQNAPDSAHFHQVLGDAMLVQGDYLKAIEEYRQALSRNRALIGAHLGIGEAMLSNGKNADGAKLTKRSFARNWPSILENPDALLGSGRIRIRT